MTTDIDKQSYFTSYMNFVEFSGFFYYIKNNYTLYIKEFYKSLLYERKLNEDIELILNEISQKEIFL